MIRYDTNAMSELVNEKYFRMSSWWNYRLALDSLAFLRDLLPLPFR
jgi:hypothetical protein